jgi:hypothetical protein
MPFVTPAPLMLACMIVSSTQLYCKLKMTQTWAYSVLRLICPVCHHFTFLQVLPCHQSPSGILNSLETKTSVQEICKDDRNRLESCPLDTLPFLDMGWLNWSFFSPLTWLASLPTKYLLLI